MRGNQTAHARHRAGTTNYFRFGEFRDGRTHSVLFLSVGRWEEVAIGNDGGQVELVYPEKDTWLGSVSLDVGYGLKKSNFVRTTHVPLKKLDDYCRDIPGDDVLIKIDVEGYEREVIQGASELLLYCKPKLIFESNDTRSRGDLFRLLTDYGYSVHLLPWYPSVASRVLELDEFLTSTASNFMAVVRTL